MAEGKKKTIIQLIWFCVLSTLAFLVQLLITTFFPKLFNLSKAMQATFSFGLFGEQTLSVFLSFLIANIAAKVISYILNRKKTFSAKNNLAFSITVYVIMCVSLIVVETIIGEPLANAYHTFVRSEELCRTLSTVTYSVVDFVIVFLLEKFVIMNDNLFKKKNVETAEVVEDVAQEQETEAVAEE